jgi:hypothetical protein
MQWRALIQRHRNSQYAAGIQFLCLTPSDSCTGESGHLLTEVIAGEWTDRSLPSELKLSELMVGALGLLPGRWLQQRAAALLGTRVRAHAPIEAAASDGPRLELVAEPEQKYRLLIGVGYVPRFRAQH